MASICQPPISARLVEIPINAISKTPIQDGGNDGRGMGILTKRGAKNVLNSQRSPLASNAKRSPLASNTKRSPLASNTKRPSLASNAKDHHSPQTQKVIAETPHLPDT